MKKLFIAFAAVVAAMFAFSSCQKDGGKDSIVGVWEITDANVTVLDVSKNQQMTIQDFYKNVLGIQMGVEDMFDLGDDKGRMELTSDGKAIFSTYENGNWEEDVRGTYTYSNNVITFSSDVANMITADKFEVKTLTDKNLVISADMTELMMEEMEAEMGGEELSPEEQAFVNMIMEMFKGYKFFMEMSFVRV